MPRKLLCFLLLLCSAPLLQANPGMTALRLTNSILYTPFALVVETYLIYFLLRKSIEQRWRFTVPYLICTFATWILFIFGPRFGAYWDLAYPSRFRSNLLCQEAVVVIVETAFVVIATRTFLRPTASPAAGFVRCAAAVLLGNVVSWVLGEILFAF